jgi:hypothetical protein
MEEKKEREREWMKYGMEEEKERKKEYRSAPY